METRLPTLPFGRTDMVLTRVGIGPTGEGPEMVDAIRRAIELGINWIDMNSLSDGRMERMTSAAVSGFPIEDRPYLMTKGGMVPDPRYQVNSLADAASGTPRLWRTARPKTLQAQVEGSLTRLGVDRLDVFQLHWPPSAADGTPLEEYWSTLLDLKAAGKVRAVGLGNHTAAQLDEAEAIGHVDCTDTGFSLATREPATEIIPWCQAHGTGFLAYRTLEAGSLANPLTPERIARLPTYRNHQMAMFRVEIEQIQFVVWNAIAPIAANRSVSLAVIAIAWTLMWPGVSGAYVGARSPDHVDAWVQAAELRLEPPELQLIADCLERTGLGEGPTIPEDVAGAGTRITGHESDG